MEYRADGKTVTVFDDDGEILVTVAAKDTAHALELREKAFRDGWQSIKTVTKKAKK